MTQAKKRAYYTVSASKIEENLDGIKEEVLQAILELRVILDNLNKVQLTDNRAVLETYIQSLHKTGIVSNRLRTVANNGHVGIVEAKWTILG